MSVSISKAAALASSALDYRAARQDMIASNIANADTPNYKSRDISFEQALRAKREEIFQDNKQQLKMAQTDDKHLKFKKESSSVVPTLYFRDGHMARNDGNSVDIDVETTEMSKNSICLTPSFKLRKKMAQFSTVL